MSELPSLDACGAWFSPVRRHSSPNCDARPPGQQPELIVVHAISLPPGEFGGPWIDHLFCNCLDPSAHQYFAQIQQLKVSAHLLVRRDGEVVQYVPLTQRAWHAGESSYLGRDACNDFSIGIELEGCDLQPFETIQYQQLAGLIVAIRAAWPTTADHAIVAHSDIAPHRKTDPGPLFDWRELEARLVSLGGLGRLGNSGQCEVRA